MNTGQIGCNSVLNMTLIILIFCLISTGVFIRASGESINANASAVVQGKARLPCDITPSTPDDKTQLVLWFKDGFGSPIYNLDLRQKSEGEPSLLNYSGVDITRRTSFYTNTTPAHLLIENVRDEDEGVYRCRVDFRKAHTRNYLVYMSVVVPPKRPTILGEKGLELESIVGPYNEGATFFLSCEAVGGRPPPRVEWWRDNQMLDDSYEVTSLGIVRNDLLVPVLTRQDFNSVFTCKTNNNNITNSKATSVTVDMNLKPLEVKILNIEPFLSATRRYELACQSAGSRPPPIMAWWNGEKRMKRTEETISQDTNVTTSILIFTPTSQDHGKTLACRAENPAIPASGIQNTWKLNVHYRPISELHIDSSISLENIHEGDDVALSCTVQSNPSIISLFWRFQGKQLIPNAESGVISNNQSLNLQHIRRNQSGRYCCVGVNSEGEGESNQIALHVKHIPVCKNGQKVSYTAARHETVTIPCEVEAFPRRLTFRWAFNHSNKLIAEGRALVTTDRLKSSLVYIPKIQKDFGTFYCFAINDMGTQLKPCVFTLIPAGPPDSPNNCTIINKTSSSFIISCQTGYDGGLIPTFFCQIIDGASHKLVVEVNSSQPIFHLTNLPSNSRFLISIYAYNNKGRSEAVVAAADTEEINTNNKQFDIEEWLPTIFGVVLGTVVILALLCVILIIVLNVRNRKRNCNKNYQMKQFDRSHIPLNRDLDDVLDDTEPIKSPDIIPHSTEQEFPSVKVKCVQPNWRDCTQHLQTCDSQFIQRNFSS